jgi:hypothetical protein
MAGPRRSDAQPRRPRLRRRQPVVVRSDEADEEGAALLHLLQPLRKEAGKVGAQRRLQHRPSTAGSGSRRRASSALDRCPCPSAGPLLPLLERGGTAASSLRR